jgi:hypothetical protein
MEKTHMSEAATAWFKTKANRKEDRKLKAETLELKRLLEKYEPRPFPIDEHPGISTSGKPFMSIEQMIRFQALKLDYEYKPLREAGKSHDEAEKEVFPEVYEYRLDLEAAKEAEKEQDNG